ncbi:GNAT family N-acetyltransferase [Mesorhizobium sp. AR10]|uniref:GNAT family N-acetyltransferase n=1 Tax=Mesorhizobium sp. AR10 TaxID=2865839 RepID=UPI00215E6B8F|nr:GNAT family N-acetyltransferase [Mesorhizobium sp. AR10]
MPVLHTPDEDLAFIRDLVLPRQEVIVAEAGKEIVGFIAVSGESVEQLYLDPAWTGRGIGSQLLVEAIAAFAGRETALLSSERWRPKVLRAPWLSRRRVRRRHQERGRPAGHPVCSRVVALSQRCPQPVCAANPSLPPPGRPARTDGRDKKPRPD